MGVTVRRCVTDKELARSLEIYNTVWPHRAVTAEDVTAWNRAALASIEMLAAVDGRDVGSAAAARLRSQPNLCFALLTVLPASRKRGAGTALYAAVSEWARERELAEIETFVDADDEPGLAFAAHRGFEEHARELGLALDVARSPRQQVVLPAGITIATLLERPDLATGAYDVELEAAPD